MKILIIEDEEAASQRLEKQLRQLEPAIQILAVTESIENSVKWLRSHAGPDLIFCDIHLADGSSFEIFKEVAVASPVIFTTAFDQYALEAFKVNSIDYLLKPIKLSNLERAIEKWKKVTAPSQSPMVDIHRLLANFPQNLVPKNYQKRLVIRYGANLKTVEIAEVAYFFTQDKIAFLNTFDDKKLPIDQSLDEMEQVLDPAEFFRINRQFIINIKAISQMYTHSKGRVKIELRPPTQQEIVVSAERSAAFKDWLTGK